jgi:ubiquinol-cytochrome c reductase cytochrome b subunit
MLMLFAVAFVILGICGVKQPDLHVEFVPFEITYRAMGQLSTAFYFAYFILMPFWTSKETCKPVPARVRMGH